MRIIICTSHQLRNERVIQIFPPTHHAISDISAVTVIILYQEQGSGSKKSSPAGLRHIDAQFKDPGRRRSSAHSIFDDEDVPLTHKTGTVGIVALAIRNRNEKKKEAEFKVINTLLMKS